MFLVGLGLGFLLGAMLAVRVGLPEIGRVLKTRTAILLARSAAARGRRR